MADPSEFPDLGDIVPIHRKKLMDLVAKTPLQMHEFEKILGWDFIKDAPQKKKDLAWALLQVGKTNLEVVAELHKALPKAYILEIRDGAPGSVCDDVGDARPDGRA
jgi:hypothetical protein